MAKPERMNILISSKLKDSLNESRKDLNTRYGLSLARTDLVRMGTSIFLRVLDTALKDKDIYTNTDIEVAVLDYINSRDKE